MLSIIVPVYNEKNTVLSLIGEVQNLPIEKEIIVVDDGSTDGTTDLIERDMRFSQIKKIYLKKNMGKGIAVREGIRHSTGKYIFIQDADLEVVPQELMKILDKAKSEKADVIYGSRFLNGSNKVTILMCLGNKLITFLTNILYSSKLTDVETPAKYFSKEIYSKLDINSRGFEFEVEITAKLLKDRHQIKEIPVSYKPRTRREGKKISWTDGLVAIVTLVKYRILK